MANLCCFNVVKRREVECVQIVHPWWYCDYVMLTLVWGIFTGVSEVCEDRVMNVDECILVILI